ncbi:hypothetical protein [Paraferrimonas sp. SM1919]|uniref:hypothetical protein n=1 Tax=Paraferrimonas sp. SM1919 TaxID=2662263 RepID=UPI0013D22E0A|nr:hypothetical protein [Paraferrimonas sp. SM1919]
MNKTSIFFALLLGSSLAFATENVQLNVEVKKTQTATQIEITKNGKLQVIKLANDELHNPQMLGKIMQKLDPDAQKVVQDLVDNIESHSVAAGEKKVKIISLDSENTHQWHEKGADSTDLIIRLIKDSNLNEQQKARIQAALDAQ